MARFPTPKDIISFMKGAANRGEAAPNRREIAKAFGVKGPDRAALRRLLSEMEDQGAITLSGKRAQIASEVPKVMVIDVTGTDNDGDLICTAASPPEGVELPVMHLPSEQAGRTKPPIGVGTRFLGRLTSLKGDTAVVSPIKVLSKASRRVLGVFRTRSKGRGVVEPTGKKRATPLDIASRDVNDAQDGDLVWAEPLPRRSYGPVRARITEVLGAVDSSDNWSLIALAENEIPVEFPAAVIDEANALSLPDAFPDHDDARDIPFLTIDPADAKDHDDAVHVAFDEAGFTLSVAIADVSWFVRSGTALDKEAARRGNSVYLVDRVVPMLPERLSNGLCSLKADEERPALICEMRYGLNGVKQSHRFYRGLMRIAAGLSYEAAQQARDGTPPDTAAPYKDSLIDPLFDAYERMAKARQKRPSLDLDMPERVIEIDDQRRVTGVRQKERLHAHQLIETMMVAANVCAAETLEEAHRTLIYRVHDSPNEERLEALRTYLQQQGYSLPKGQVIRPESFNRVLAMAAERNQTDVIAMAILRTQAQAVYDTDNVGHFGLSLPKYAHFTSPIRRYADLTVHRGLVAALRLGAGGIKADEEARLPDIAEAISLTERRAIAAERATADRFIAAFLAPQIGAQLKGRITGATRAGLFIALDDTGADGFVPARTLHEDRFWHDERLGALVGERTKARYTLGQRVEVILREATPVQGGLLLEMLSSPVRPAKAASKEPGPGKGPHKGKGKKATATRIKETATADAPENAPSTEKTLRRRPRKKQG